MSLNKQTSAKKFLFLSPTRTITLSFAAVILLGTFLLMLPISSRQQEMSTFLDCIFTATSATCVTGLVVFDTFTHWTVFGQTVILCLIQIGGLGLVTLTVFFNIAIGRKLGLRGMHLAQESVSSIDSDVQFLVKLVISTSLIVESIGALVLMTQFIPKYGSDGIFISIFLAVSAFCNAGFDILGRESPFISLMNYQDNPTVLITIGLLVLIGGIGFIVIHDIISARKNHKQLTLHTRIVLVITGILLLTGMLVTALLEWNNPETLDALPNAGQKILAAWFHSISCRTAGFNTISMERLYDSTKFFSCILMFIGAAPGSTGGGIKCTTAAVVFMTVYSVIRGSEDTTIFHRRVLKPAVYKSFAVSILGGLAVAITTGCIIFTMKSTHAIMGIDALFESVSAFATVGLSSGITSIANTLSKILLIFSMYIGRLGPVTFFLALAARPVKNRKYVLPEGKIQIG